MATKGRESKGSVLNKMIRILQAVNSLSPHDPLLDGDPIPLDDFASTVGLDCGECARIIRKINLGCGDALPAAYVDFDEETGLLTPHRLVFAFDGLLRLSKSEAYALLMALRASGIDSDGKLVSKLAGALPVLDLERLSLMAGEAGVSRQALETVADAVSRRLVVSISYRDALGSVSRRDVEPLALWFDAAESTWTFSAWCRLRRSVRLFRADRLVCDPVPTGETFAQRTVHEPLGPLDRMDLSPLAVLAVHDPGSLELAGVWHGIEALTNVEDSLAGRLDAEDLKRGGFIATVPWIEGSPWLPCAVVATLGGVEVIEPEALRDEVSRVAADYLARLV